MNSRAFFSTAAMAAGLLLLAAPTRAEDEQFKASAQIYDTYCAQCHGLQRNGKGINTAGMAVQPRDHSDTKGMSAIPPEQMFSVIKEGGTAANKSALMPPWGSVLNDEQIKGMVAYLRHVCRCDASN